LADFQFDVDIDCVPEGTLVFPHEPIMRVSGPIIPAQLLETALLNLVCFPTLVASKAARIKLAAGDRPVFEFGLRRAQGPDGGLTASLAAYVGGSDGSSNVLAGKLYGIPITGTHAHSWVMCFEDELEAFSAYAQAMPNNCYFLVDSYDTISGVENAIKVGKHLRETGHEMLGVRLDSGDLAYLSSESRRLLDQAGFSDAKIIASNDLDEGIISSLKDQGAAIDVWAVGTKLVTCDSQPSLGGVYKLSAERQKGASKWRYCLKLSEQAVKISNPGFLQVRRFKQDGEFIGDMIFDEELLKGSKWTIVDPIDFTRRKQVSASISYEDLLVPIFRGGKPVYERRDLAEAKERVRVQMAGFHPGIKRLLNPHQYPAGLEGNLHDLKTELILKGRGLTVE
ncbi:MAG: nicotinate phosphoribosyltransferase, partial [Candidatus Obscuribacterales bacterium]|nr:nicotinate phosphoribosyltransferase [Candidatus Obscuribacterales bacterium]